MPSASDFSALTARSGRDHERQAKVWSPAWTQVPLACRHPGQSGPHVDQAARQPLGGGHQAAGPNRLLGVFWFAGCLNMRPGRRKRIIRTNCSSGGVTRLKTQTRQRRTHALQDHFASTTNDGNADGLSSRRRDDRQEPQSLINACGIACGISPVVIMPRSAWPLSAACHRGRAARPDRPADRAPRRGP